MTMSVDDDENYSIKHMEGTRLQKEGEGDVCHNWAGSVLCHIIKNSKATA